MAEKKVKKYLLEDFSRNPDGSLKDKVLGYYTGPFSPWLGHALMAGPFEAHVNLDYTGPPGVSTGIYYGLCFQLGKWEHTVMKADEWIEVSPVHAQYYQLTQKQKEDLEAKIKSGLASSAQSVADLELLLHDKRKYEEMLHYMGYQSNTIDATVQIDFSTDDKGRQKRVDNHSLKAMFIDQIDMHTGEGISMRSIVGRWPTLISDFMKMDDNDIDPDNVRRKLDITRAEAVVLITKNKLYKEWKNIFLPEVASRYQRIMELVRSRQQSVEQYKEWLKPYIARHKLIEEGLSSSATRKHMRTFFITGMGHAVSSAQIVLWVWKDFMSPELQKAGGEEYELHKVRPDDEWTRKNLIFDQNHGLIVKYPWITKEWVDEQVEDIWARNWLTRKLYYSFLIITFMRTNMKSATGAELEDGQFDVNLISMSRNVVLTKLLELKAKQEELDMYVDTLLGIPHKISGKPSIFKPEKENKIGDLFDKLGMKFNFMKRGPYEREWDERLTKYYFAPIAGGRYVPVVNFIKQRMGYGN
ncbi:MAG: hypothetical protein NT120_02990 [Candidatus Aenigmarchaeota archaeon]|nr:hypothetical protein [Candidatus Aenigmarchaeota archaeon]